nr:MAG TPA: hypothetical protein [Bacteriophage sp.]
MFYMSIFCYLLGTLGTPQHTSVYFRLHQTHQLTYITHTSSTTTNTKPCNDSFSNFMIL